MGSQVVSSYALRPPYTQLMPVDLKREGSVVTAGYGEALVWYPERSVDVTWEFEVIEKRAPGLALIVVLPPPEAVVHYAPILRRLGQLVPAAVLPALDDSDPRTFSQSLTCVPRRPDEALLSHLRRRGMLVDSRAASDIAAIVKASEELGTVTQVARRLTTSRRTIGRHLAAANLPAPSRWLQFSRMFRAALLLQGQDTTVARAARRLGYPDGFTFSNQMKRLIGLRPTAVRQYLGWEWIIEAWLAREFSHSRDRSLIAKSNRALPHVSMHRGKPQ